MNKFYDKTLSEGVAECGKFMDLIQRVNKDASVLDTLSLEELERINAYYEKRNRGLEKQIARLKKDSD